MTDSAGSSELLKTPLHALHLEHGARMVGFAGYEMPVNYGPGVLKEHLHCRARAGLFDVSHMGQIMVEGIDLARRLEALMPVDLIDLENGRQKYALLLNDEGGIRDDLMVMNRGDQWMLVVNAACKHDDLAWLREAAGDKLSFMLMDDRALLALQGPEAASVLASLTDHPIEYMTFMDVAGFEIAGCTCIVSRSGYTGEDGFEISVPADEADTLARALLAHEAVDLIGLGARDSLRMEAGLCLYGQDMDQTVTPVEAGLRWAISPARRSNGERAGGFPGADRVLAQIDNGAEVTLTGLLPGGKAPMRHGTTIHDADGNQIGEITSGGFGPSLGKPLSMARISTAQAAPGTELLAEVRGKRLPATVTKLPFVPHNYKRA